MTVKSSKVRGYVKAVRKLRQAKGRLLAKEYKLAPLRARIAALEVGVTTRRYKLTGKQMREAESILKSEAEAAR